MDITFFLIITQLVIVLVNTFLCRVGLGSIKIAGQYLFQVHIARGSITYKKWTSWLIHSSTYAYMNLFKCSKLLICLTDFKDFKSYMT